MDIKGLFGWVRRRWNSRFAFLRWPLPILSERVRATETEGLINARAAGKRYPLRAVRYWWVHCALLDEVRRVENELVIADVGCNQGILKRFVGDIPRTTWIGLDWKLDGERLRQDGYADAHECDFDQPLPLPNNSVDVVVFLHVIEHLPRPSFTISELSRILRPGGLLLAGSPVAPRLVARVRQWQLQSRKKKGMIKVGGHIQAMDGTRWRRLARTSGLRVEILTGTFLARWSANPLENQAWWVRLNQLWGALFPSLGGELYLAARKLREPYANNARQPTVAPTPVWRTAWAWACLLVIVCAASWFGLSWLDAKDCPLRKMVAEHQDGNDTFYVLDHPALECLEFQNDVKKLRYDHEILSANAQDTGTGKDPHFLVSAVSTPSLAPILKNTNLRIVERLNINGTAFDLLSSEGYELPLDALVGKRRG